MLAWTVLAIWSPTLAAAKPLNGYIGGPTGAIGGGLFIQPHDVAVYRAGTASVADDKLFVAEAGLSSNGRVHRLDSDGNFETMWGRDTVRPGFPGDTGTGFEICSAVISGAAGCKAAPAGSATGEFDNPTGIAIDDDAGRVYVIDRGNRRVQEFDLDGGFVRAWGWDVAPEGQPGDTPSDQFEICTALCQAGTAGLGAGQFANAAIGSIAISPVAPNHLFVTDAGNRRVQEFEADGDFVRAWGWGVDTSAAQFETCTTASGCGQGLAAGTANGQFASSPSNWPRHVAVDADGVVYASDATANQRIIRFDSDPAPTPPDATGTLLEALPSPALLSAGTTAGLEIDPVTGNLFVVRDRSTPGGAVLAAVRELADPGAVLTGGPPNPTVAETHTFADESDGAIGDVVKSIGYNPDSGYIYLAVPGLYTPPVGNFSGCVSFDLGCQGLMVSATTTGPHAGVLDAPSDVGASTVELEGSVNAGGGVASYRFQVSSDGSNWTDASAPRYVAGSDARAVSASVSGLQPATLYRVRMVVAKQDEIATTNTVASNEDVFLTDAAAPAVKTLGSSKRTDVSVRLRGQVDPNGSPASYRFEYGPAGGSFDHHVPIPDAQAGSGNDLQPVTQDISGLQPDTDYHYRIVATNFVATSTGTPVAFTTRPAAALPEPPAGRAYELVSPADKVAGVGVGIWYQGPATAGQVGFPANDAERFAVQGTFGAVLGDAGFSFANDWMLAERTDQGWVSNPLVNRRAYGSHTLVFINPIAATPDLALTSWRGTTIKLFAEMENWAKETTGAAVYLRNWVTGKWELAAPTAPFQGSTSGGMAIAAVGTSSVLTATTHGVGGPGDPTLDLSSGVASVYLHEAPDGLSDTFPGDGSRSVANVCSSGTELPRRVDVGGGAFEITAQPCPAPQPNRDAAVTSSGGAALGDDREGVISADGSRVFFMSPQPSDAIPPCSGVDQATSCPPQLFVRQRTDTGFLTRWISRSEVAGQDARLLGPAFFEGASRDGDKVFFRTSSPLTDDDRNGEGTAPPAGGVVDGVASGESWDLYMYDMPDDPEADPADGDLVRISAGPQGTGDCNSPFDGQAGSAALRFASDDGSRLYFACAAPLDGVPVPDDGTITEPGGTPASNDAVNLYAYDTARPLAQRWRFVARLPRLGALGACASRGAIAGMAIAPVNAQASIPSISESINCVHGDRDGDLISFFTDGQLTDDDPDASSGDVYAYDTTRDELIRISAPQGGTGGTYPCTLEPAGPSCYADDGIGPTPSVTRLPPLNVAEDPDGDRVVFLQSRSRLIPADKDDRYDVYEWREGELRLLTTGDGDAMYVGSDRSGRNVYFATRDRLSWQDRDAVLDVYTARIGNGIPQPAPTDETCDPTADQCQGESTTPKPPTIDSDSPAAGNPTTPTRNKPTVRQPTRKALRHAARRGVISLRIDVATPASVHLTAKARLNGKNRRIGHTTAGIAKTATVKLRLNRAARQRLRSGKTLAVTITAKTSGSRPTNINFKLRR